MSRMRFVVPLLFVAACNSVTVVPIQDEEDADRDASTDASTDTSIEAEVADASDDG